MLPALSSLGKAGLEKVKGISYQAGCSHADICQLRPRTRPGNELCHSPHCMQCVFWEPNQLLPATEMLSGMRATTPAMASSAQFLCSNGGGEKRRNQKGDWHSATPTMHQACRVWDFQWQPHKFGVPLEEREAAPLQAELQEVLRHSLALTQWETKACRSFAGARAWVVPCEREPWGP